MVRGLPDLGDDLGAFIEMSVGGAKPGTTGQWMVGPQPTVPDSNGVARCIHHGIVPGRRRICLAISQAEAAGPNARHARRWLEVDHEWQNLQIRRFADVGANVAYLGEWHTHPASIDATPSRTDRRTLHLLATDRALDCPCPVMMILFPDRDGWNYAAWELGERRRRRLPFASPQVERATVIVVDDA